MTTSLFKASATSLNVDLYAYSKEFEKESYSFLSEMFNNVNSINKLRQHTTLQEKKVYGYAERQTFSECTRKEITQDTEVYTFHLSKDYSISHTFTLYDPEDETCILDFLELRLFSSSRGETTVYEAISREFLACWIRLFKQKVVTQTGECLLPIFLNRFLLHHYTEWLPPLTFEFTFKKSAKERNPLLCYRGQSLFAGNRSVYRNVLIKEPFYYFYDGISEISRYKKWIPLEKEETPIYLSYSNVSEPFHRMSDLYIVVRNTGTSTTVIKKIEFYTESSPMFSYDTKLLSSVFSPVDKWKHTYQPTDLELSFAPEISEVYYLPFSSVNHPFEEYNPRPYFNTQGVANFTIKLMSEESKGEVSLCYLSPAQIKAN